MFLHAILFAQLLLGSETPLSARVDVRPAAFDQTAPAVAGNGERFLVAWTDVRRSQSDIYVTRVDTDGRPLDAFGRRIGRGKNPRVASAGSDFLVVWETGTSLQSLRVAPNLAANAAAPHTLPFAGAFALASNGSTYLLMTPSGWMLLDLDGAPLRAVPGSFGAPIGVAAIGGKYYVAENGALHIVADDGTVTNVAVLRLTQSASATFSAAFAPASFIVADNTGTYAVIGYDGAVQARGALPWGISQPPTAAWDGQEFLLAQPRGYAWRIGLDGVLRATVRFANTDNSANTLRITSGGAAQLAVWSQQNDFTYDIIARATLGFSSLTPDPVAPTLISYSGEAEGDLAVARSARGMAVLWDDADRWLRVSASFNGREPFPLQSTHGPDYVGWPAVAAGKSTYLAAWRHAAIPGPDQILAQRFDLDGNAIDTQPIVVASEPTTSLAMIHMNPQVPSIAFDGATYLVVWADDNTIYTTQLPEAGPPINHGETDVPNQSGAPISATQAFWTGSEFFITYAVARFPTVPEAPETSLKVSALTLKGTSATLVDTPEAFSALAKRVAMARGTSAIAAVWQTEADAPALLVGLTTLDGTAFRAPRVVVQRQQPQTLEAAQIAWSGSEFVVTWVENNRLMAMRFDPSLDALDSEPIEISSGPIAPLPSIMTRTPAGMQISYSRADDANGGAPRATMRVLDQLPQPLHRRAVHP